MKLSDRLRRPLPTAAIFLCYGLCFAVPAPRWIGLGAACGNPSGAALAVPPGAGDFGERPTPRSMACVAFFGVTGLHLGPHEVGR